MTNLQTTLEQLCKLADDMDYMDTISTRDALRELLRIIIEEKNNAE